MTKRSLITLILSTIGGLLFALGICMSLISEWHAFDAGVKTTIAGIVILGGLFIFLIKTSEKKFKMPKLKSILIFLLAVGGALILGLGMAMTMVWSGMLIQGIIVGIFGIVLLISLIPIYKGGIK